MGKTIQFSSFRPELQKVEKEVDVVLKFPDVDPLNPPVLTMSEVAFKYSADKVIFNCVNLNANLESRICIVSWKLIVSINNINLLIYSYFICFDQNFPPKFEISKKISKIEICPNSIADYYSR